MPEIVVVPNPNVTDIWVVQNAESDYASIVVVQPTPVVSLVDTGKGDPGPAGPMGESQIVFARDYEVTITQGRQAYRFPFAATLVGVSACMGVPCTGSPTILDINVDGISIFTNQANRPQVPPITGDLPEITLNVPIVPGNRVTIDIDDIGSTLAGEDLSVFVRYEKA
jgi:hypothetical protein